MASTILNWISSRARRKRNAHEIYGSIVAAARNPSLYSTFEVPDTLEGRFEMLVVHMFVFLERLRDPDEQGYGALEQELVDLFFADMDVTTRQAGVGDMAVPKRMRELAQVFSERMEGYNAVFPTKGKDALAGKLESLVFGGGPQAKTRAARLAAYLRQLRDTLQNMPADALQSVGSWDQGNMKEEVR